MRADGVGHDGGEVAGALAAAAGLAELLAEQIHDAEAIGAGADAAATRALVERLLNLRPEDGHLLELVRWFATTCDLSAALAATAERGGPDARVTRPG